MSQLGAARVAPEKLVPHRPAASSSLRKHQRKCDMFVPKGYLLLTAAVDQLAEARRTAGQTNDDGQNAARVELRAEFHSGSILTTVISPGSGDTYTICPHTLGSRKSSDLA